MANRHAKGISEFKLAKKENLEHTRTTLVTFLALVIFLVGFCFWVMEPFILAITMGAIFALLAHPVFNKLRSKNVSPRIASALVTVGILLLAIIPISIFLSLAIKQGMDFARAASQSETLSIQPLIATISKSSILKITGSTPEELSLKIQESIQSAGKTGLAITLGIVGRIPNVILQVVLSCISCFFLLVDGHRLGSWVKNKIPLDRDISKRVATSFKETAVSSVLATLAAGAAQSVVMILGFLILGVPGVFLAAGATFILAWIPLLGSSPVWIAASIFLFGQGAIWKVFAMVVFGLSAGVLDNIVRPLVLKGRTNMHPLVSLVAIFGGIRFFGIMGVFLGPVLAAVTISILQIWPAVAQRFGLMTLES